MADVDAQDTQEQEQKRPLTLNRPGGRLELRRPAESSGQVRQSFSHGRSKTVTVEVRKKRIFGPGGTPEPVRTEAEPAVARAAQPAAEAPAAEPIRRPVAIPRALTAEEKAGRFRAVQDAAKADVDQRRLNALAEADRRRQEDERAAEESRLQAEEDARRRYEEEDAKKRGVEEAKKRSEDQESQRKEDESRREVAERAGKAAAAKVAALAAAGKVAMPAEEEEEPASARRPGALPKRPAMPIRRDERRRTGKLTVTRALSDDEGERMRSLASVRRARERERRLHRGDEQIKIVREVIIPETITVQELANRMAERDWW
jgi:translation initiation factor IF-2